MTTTTEVLRFPLGTTVVDREHPHWAPLREVLSPFFTVCVTVGRVSSECVTVQISPELVSTRTSPRYGEGPMFGLVHDELQIEPGVFVLIHGVARQEGEVLLAFGRGKNILDRLVEARRPR